MNGGDMGQLMFRAGVAGVYMRRTTQADVPTYRGLRISPMQWPEWSGRMPSADDMSTISIVTDGWELAMVAAASPVPQVITVHFMAEDGRAFFPPRGYSFQAEALALLAYKMALELATAQPDMESVYGDSYLIMNTYRLTGDVMEPPLIAIGGVGVLGNSALDRYEVGLLWKSPGEDHEGTFFVKPYYSSGPLTPLLSLRDGGLMEPSEEDVKRLRRFHGFILRRALGDRASACPSIGST